MASSLASIVRRPRRLVCSAELYDTMFLPELCQGGRGELEVACCVCVDTVVSVEVPMYLLYIYPGVNSGASL